MRDWNGVFCVSYEGLRRLLRALRDLGAAERTAECNVLVMKTYNPLAALAVIEKRTEESSAFYDSIVRVAPAMRGFDFMTAGEFASDTIAILREWSHRLGGRTFHVRLHRRGAKDDLGMQDTEHLFNDAVVDAPAKPDNPGRVSFTEPAAVIAINTIDQRTGL